jgi:chromosome segregation ATPase
MEEYIQLIREKSQLMYDINSIKRYIEDLEYDNNLKETWNYFMKELSEINNKIEEITKPQLKELQEKKLAILDKIKNYDEEIYKLKSQLKEVDLLIQDLT